MKHDLGMYLAIWIIAAPVVASLLLSGLGRNRQEYSPAETPGDRPRRW